MDLNFSGRGLAFLSHYKATDDIRYYLNGIYIAPLSREAGGGVIGAATNGHVLGMWHDKGGHADRAAILRVSKKLAAACADKTIGEHEPTLVLADNRLTVMRGGEELYIQPNEYRDPSKKPKRGWDREPWEVAGDFPSLDRVVPNHAEATIGMTGTVNARYLELIAKSMPKDRFKHFGGVAIRQVNKDSSNLVLFEAMPEAIVIIMPMRSEVGAPEWLPRWRETTLRAKATAALPIPGRQPSDAAPPQGFITGGKHHGHSGVPA